MIRFPFTAIVGQDALRRALLLCAVRPDIGGVLVRGERGTAKSTAARGLTALLPPLRAVVGCRFGCDPDAPGERCAECAARAAEGPLPVGLRPTPFVDLPVSATEDRVVGALDIERVLRTGERGFEPGLLAAAHRGVLYVDEVNLLDDHVVDALLDAAATGVNVVEREGISFSHPARFVLVGTMNPEEGELRPQLTDRFGLAVDVEAAGSVEERAEIVRRRLAFDADPEAFAARYAADEEALRARIEAARALLPAVTVVDRDLRVTAEIVRAAGIDGHRGELAIVKAAQANAALERRTLLTLEDLDLAARLALPHRRREGPLLGQSSDMSAVHEVIERAAAAAAGEPEAAPVRRPGGEPVAAGDDAPKSGRILPAAYPRA